MEWHPSGRSVCLPLLIFPCTIKSRSSLLAPAQTGRAGKRAVKRLWCGGGNKGRVQRNKTKNEILGRQVINNSLHTICKQSQHKMSSIQSLADSILCANNLTRAQQYWRWVTVTTIDMGRKEGGHCAAFTQKLGPRLTQCGLGRGLLLYQMACSSIQPFGHNRHGPKTGGQCPF